MSIQLAEQLKREWTDRYVMIHTGAPELRRFDGLVGQVKTVNMNCRLLIQFETPADISWYDIDPKFVTVVVREAEATATSSAPRTASIDVTDRPLDRIRAQATASGTAKPTVDAAARTPPPEKKLVSVEPKETTAKSPPPPAATSTGRPASAMSAGGGITPFDQVRSQAQSTEDRTVASERVFDTVFERIRRHVAEDQKPESP